MPAIDGLRTLAVLLVMATHFGKLQMGWIGVHLFFVISGFLITGILLHDRDRAPGLGAYLKRFFWRRSLRIFPAWYLYLAALLILYWLTGKPYDLVPELPWLATYTYNWHSSLARPDIGQGYHGGHLWSLCVEEQFYLVWPFVVFLVPNKALGPTFLAIVAMGPALRWVAGLWMASTWPADFAQGQSVYTMTTSHLDALALGGAIAFYRIHQWVQRPLLWLLGGLILFAAYGAFAYLSLPRLGVGMGVSSFGYTYNTLQLGNHLWVFTVVNLAMATLLLVAAGKDNWLKTALTHPALTGIGAVSYGMYLWHQLAILAVEWGFQALGLPMEGALPTASRFLVFAGLTILWAKVLFHFFEKPFLRLKDRTAVPRQVAA